MPSLITPVILSGGAGTRLWPLSTAETPKQMLRLAGERTMLQATAARVADRARFAAPVVVANAAHANAIETQLDAIGCRPDALVLEPMGRNTAPAIALAALAAPDGLLLVMPSDHVIGDVDAFRAAVDRAAPLAVRDHARTARNGLRLYQARRRACRGGAPGRPFRRETAA